MATDGLEFDLKVQLISLTPRAAMALLSGCESCGHSLIVRGKVQPGARVTLAATPIKDSPVHNRMDVVAHCGPCFWAAGRAIEKEVIRNEQ